ncbi:MAG: hypothetical protein R2825_05845 [Saprospiraceae bacterium]
MQGAPSVAAAATASGGTTPIFLVEAVASPATAPVGCQWATTPLP